MNFSLEEPIAFATLWIIVWNQIHGTPLGSGDSTHTLLFVFSSLPLTLFSLSFVFCTILTSVRINHTLEGYTSLNVHTP